MDEDVRWRQRFDNFRKSLALLETAIKVDRPDQLQRAGIVKYFEMTFELSWKLMKDYLEDQGFLNIRSPREAVKKTFEIGIISDGSQWLQGLEDRNLTAHTYNEETALQVDTMIRETYYILFKKLQAEFSKL